MSSLPTRDNDAAGTPSRNIDGGWQNSINPLHVYSEELQAVARLGSADLDSAALGTTSPPTFPTTTPATTSAPATDSGNVVSTFEIEGREGREDRNDREDRGAHASRHQRSASSTSAVRSFLSASAEALRPANNARRTRVWCKDEGGMGMMIIVTLCFTIINLLLLLVLHCTALFDKLQGRPGVRKMLLVTPAVVMAVGVVCSILLGRVVWALISITCRHGATFTLVGQRLREQKHSRWRLVRAFDLYELYTSPGGRFFDLFEFAREVLESFLQILAVREYGDNGVDRAFLDIYVVIVGLNSLSSIALMVPKCAPAHWGLQSPETRARRERLVLTLDVICDSLCT